MFFRIKQKSKSSKDVKSYDKSKQKPIIHASICTGERVAGFKNLENGKFEGIMLIRKDSDLEEFKKMYGITEELPKEY